ncbi:MAG TPA: hypothetical protein VGL56_16795 [Fimbriimonadaceae bacterium]
MGDIDRIQPVISSLQSLSSTQRVGDGARQHNPQEKKEKPHKEDQVELTNELEVEEEPLVEHIAAEPGGGLDLAV